jgi:guanylate kinase
MAENKTKGKIVIISGPSGVGKSTICKSVAERMDDVFLSVSLTTRPKSEKEVNGKEYCFVSRNEFEEQIKNGKLLEHAEVFGNLYGTPKDKTDLALQDGKTIILEIDVQGARETKKKYPDSIMIFILPPSQRELANRMDNRGRDDEETAAKRLNQASSEIAAAWQYYEYLVINDDLENAIDEVVQIIEQSNGE